MTDTIEPGTGLEPAMGPGSSDPVMIAASDDRVSPPPVGAGSGPDDGWPQEKSADDFNRELRQRRLRLGVLLGFFVLAGVLWGMAVIYLILMIVASIFLHEMGHYVAARWSGMKVTEFFIGFGPRIWSFKRGETEYGIKLIWAGAYVKIIGMNNLDEVHPHDEPRTFRRKSYPKRVFVAFAGPAMNLLLAFVLLVGLALTWGSPPGPFDETFPAVDVAPGSAADLGGIQSGDELLSLDGEPVPSDFDVFSPLVAARPGQDVEFVVDRGGEQVTLAVTLGDRILGVSGLEWPRLTSVNSGSAGGDAGLRPGDIIVGIDGEPAPADFDGFKAVVVDAGGESVTLEVAREGETYGAVLVVPAGTQPDGFLGVSQANLVPEALGPADAVTESGSYLGTVVVLSAEGLFGFFSPSGLAGFAELIFSPAEDTAAEPVAVVHPEGTDDAEVAETSLQPLPVVLSFEEQPQRVSSIVGVVQIGRQLNVPGAIILMVWLNIFLALFNLVPLLPFDGGHIAVATYERIREALGQVGLVKAKLIGGRYMADFSRLIPVTYAVVGLVLFVGLGALYLDIVDPTELPS